MLADVLPKLLLQPSPSLAAVRRAARGVHGRTREWLCGLGGHDYLRHVDGDRLSLKCTNCGHQTPGWSIDVRRSRRAA